MLNIRAQIMRDEGLRLTVYDDSEGVPTIGFGRNLRDRGISSAEAEVMLDNDIRETTDEVNRALPWAATLDEVRQGVLINLCFNVGAAGLLGFRKMLAALEVGDWDLAARELLDSKYHVQLASEQNV